MKTAREIATFVGGALHGDPSVRVETVGSLERAGDAALSYAETQYLDRIPSSRAACLLIPPGEVPDRTVIVVNEPRVAFAKVAHWLAPPVRPFEGVHPTAVVAESATIEPNAAIGPWAVIEAGAHIGRSTLVFPGCYIGRDCRIGVDAVLYPNVVLYPGVALGDRVVVHAGVVIGADGFGFVFDGTRHLKVPQVGHVTVGADVEVGANACIDRGALDETVLDDGVKVDNLCQIAHNVRIGEHTVVSAQTGIAGSSRVGHHATIGGQVGIADYCRIDDHALVGAQCGVPTRKRVPGGEVFWGTPARPLRQIKAQQAFLGRLPKIAAEVKRLRDEIDELRAKLERGEVC